MWVLVRHGQWAWLLCDVGVQGITRIDRLSAAPLRTLTISGKLKPVRCCACLLF